MIRVGIVGFGASAKTFHLPFLLARPETFRVTAVLERQAKEAPGLLPQARVHQDLDAFLADRDWDLGIVTLPNDLHGSTAVRILDSGRAVVVEKPLSVTVADGQAIVDKAHYQDFAQLLAAQNPDILFTHWPIDNHRDHRALSQLALDAWLASHKKAALYYYEVADDTMMFSPSDYVDISAPEIESLRHAACFAHASQQPEKWYPRQVEITRFRGSQSGHAQAEAFLRHWESHAVLLP